MAKPGNPPSKPQRDRGAEPHANQATAKALLSLLLHAEELRSSLKGADIDLSEEVSIEELVARLARNSLTGVDHPPYRQLDLEDKATLLRAHLDLVQKELRDSPDLRAEFERHALFQDQYRLLSRSEPDRVGIEIANEVTMNWSDRKVAPYKDQVWAWLKRPDLFILHVYKKWYDAGELELRHLTRDPQLHATYRAMIERHPAREIFGQQYGSKNAQANHRP